MADVATSTVTPASVDDPTLARMLALVQGWQQTGDHRAIFLECYAQMTDNMLRAVQAGRFHDADWVTVLLRHFADYYFDALAAYEQDSSAPAVWQVAFDTARQGKAMAVQHLLLGVNAHINYDLVFAVADLLAPDWDTLPDERRQQRHADFCLVNQIIAETIDAVQDSVLERYAPAMDLIDRLFGRADEWLIAKLITTWRNRVWDYAVQWTEAIEDAERAVLRRQVEAASLRQTRQIMSINA